MNETKGHLLILYDNDIIKRGLRPSWGFSCLVTLPQNTILFDTGGDASILFGNMQKMAVDPIQINRVVISHGHGDHVGGLGGFLQHRHNVTVYLPASFPERFKVEVDKMGADVESVGETAMIQEGVYSTGEMGAFIKEQSLVMKTAEGLLIVTGCAHPGIVEIVDKSAAIFEEKVYLLLGGFHLMGYSPASIRAIIDKLDGLKVERIAPCHCTGDTAMAVFKDYYDDNFIRCGAGLSIEIPPLVA